MIDIQRIAKFYGGTVCNGNAVIRTPGHSSRDRGTALKPSVGAPDGLLVTCYNGDTADALAVKDMLRRDGLLPLHSAPARDLSPAERRGLSYQLEASKRRRLAGEEAAAQVAGDAWAKASRASRGHPYLVAKRLKPFGIRQSGDALLVPMVDAQFQLWNVQRIRPDGRKLFAKGARTAGLFWPHGLHCADGNPTAGPLVIGEGFATMAVVHAETGLGVAAAMSARNLGSVARAMRQVFPTRPIIIAADDDRHLPANIGLRAAREAAGAVDGQIAVPLPETDRRKSGADFADIPRDEVSAHFLTVNPGRLAA
ncbi:hypothetical protein GRI62_14155 [Erythrobacter arachoides]|uniref:Toprim domain-containing protein n=1 Tax=Aurantiacibacter arachoides TaxID=1850444 RepID=A0A845A2I6_9SPHN|nr:toprim domain-containing protein [Aurantiacibacter arachoides]MXO94741.1 hypothetical protein [Aurantiacibacter arachoides]GGD61009.1 hypothetical protein GCM10011411_21580 [Aurantiacibacter arachoides]